jgi:two-component system, NtrC family, nitrogen regulation sensor histidine kinase NtrY
MKLRGRLTLTLAAAALVPISLAAIVTRQVIADSARSNYLDQRGSVAKKIEAQLDQLATGVTNATESLAAGNHQLISQLSLLIVNQTLERESLKPLRAQSVLMMRGLSLDALTITAPDDETLISPHYPDANSKPNAQIRQRANSTRAAYFVRDQVRTGGDYQPVLLAQASQFASDRGITLAVSAGRRVTQELLDFVRDEGHVDARVVAPDGKPLLPSRWDWAAYSADPIGIPLKGPTGAAIATVQVGVSAADLDNLLLKVTYTSVALALAALGATVLVGVLVARRTTRDLDLLVEGSLAASRGDLDHRVPVRSKDEVGAVASAFNFMMEDLRTSKERLVIAERIAAWQEIARRLAHEIKNPLTPIQMAMDTLRKTWRKKHPSFDEILEESTSTVLQEADRLKRIVAEFSDFARMPKPEFQRIDLNEVIRGAVSLYQGAEGPKVETTLANQLPQLDADKGQLHQVVLNLVENSREAIGQRPGGRITVATRVGEAGDRALLVVEDNGPGVPTELKDKVFAPYYTTKHSKGGTGLGLAIVHRIVSDHGGRIALSDPPGGGARFAIELPLRNGTALLASRI